MEIDYANSQMRKTLESSILIGKKYGHLRRKLEIRLSELRTVDSLAEISQNPPPRRHKLTHNKAGCWGVDVSKNWRIILMPIGRFDPDNLNTITRVQILDIEDYH